jgi:hypothetical protein
MDITEKSHAYPLLKANPLQIWFFTCEQILDPSFTQGYHVLPSPGTVQYLGLPECLSYSRYKTRYAGNLDFYMLSQSMKKAAYLDSDKSVLKTWQKYCRNDPVVHMIIRPMLSLSPNCVRSASHHETLAARKAILSRYFTEMPPKLPITELEPRILSIYENAIRIVAEDGTLAIIQKKAFTGLMKDCQYLKVPISNLHLSGFDHQGGTKHFDLTKESWKHLARGPWKAEFACLYKSYNAKVKMREREESPLWQFLIDIGLCGPGKAHECERCNDEKFRVYIKKRGSTQWLNPSYTFEAATKKNIGGLLSVTNKSTSAF